MNAHIKTYETAVSRRQAMIGAAGLSFAFALGGRVDAAVVAGERSGQALSPWVSVGRMARSPLCRRRQRWGRDRIWLPLIIAESLMPTGTR